LEMKMKSEKYDSDDGGDEVTYCDLRVESRSISTRAVVTTSEDLESLGSHQIHERMGQLFHGNLRSRKRIPDHIVTINSILNDHNDEDDNFNLHRLVQNNLFDNFTPAKETQAPQAQPQSHGSEIKTPSAMDVSLDRPSHWGDPPLLSKLSRNGKRQHSVSTTSAKTPRAKIKISKPFIPSPMIKHSDFNVSKIAFQPSWMSGTPSDVATSSSSAALPQEEALEEFRGPFEEDRDDSAFQQAAPFSQLAPLPLLHHPPASAASPSPDRAFPRGGAGSGRGAKKGSVAAAGSLRSQLGKLWRDVEGAESRLLNLLLDGPSPPRAGCDLQDPRNRALSRLDLAVSLQPRLKDSSPHLEVFSAAVLGVALLSRPPSDVTEDRGSSAGREEALVSLEGCSVLLFMKPDQQRGLRRGAGTQVRVRVYDPIVMAIPAASSLRRCLSSAVDPAGVAPTHAVIGTQCWEALGDGS